MYNDVRNEKNLMKNDKREMARSLKLITKDRERTNILRKWEQKSIAYLVQKVPSWISSDGLTAFGLFGNLIVASSFVMGALLNRYLLLISLPGFIINWIGDSLDGRLAYYRNKPRKWYGFSLDVTVDWIGVILIGLGYMIYVNNVNYIDSRWLYTGFFFVVMYGWEMITAQLRYKIGGKYSIDSGIFGPTEVRLILAIIFTTEVFVPATIQYLASITCIILLVSNLVEMRNLLKLADKRDKADL